jgi:hypothetical protein
LVAGISSVACFTSALVVVTGAMHTTTWASVLPLFYAGIRVATGLGERVIIKFILDVTHAIELPHVAIDFFARRRTGILIITTLVLVKIALPILKSLLDLRAVACCT